MSNPAPYFPPIMSDVVIDLYHGDNVNVDFSVIRSENIAIREHRRSDSEGEPGYMDGSDLP